MKDPWVELLKAAEEIVRNKPTWKKYIDGTPLSNDIPVWMANFAEEYASPTPAIVEREPVAWTFEFEGVKHVTLTDPRPIAEKHPERRKSITPLYEHPSPAASATVTFGSKTVSLQPGDSLTLDAAAVAQLVDALEIIAGDKQCSDNTMGNADVAKAALAAVRGSK